MSDCVCQTGQNKIFALTWQIHMKGQGGRTSFRAIDSILCKTPTAEGLTAALWYVSRKVWEWEGRWYSGSGRSKDFFSSSSDCK